MKIIFALLAVSCAFTISGCATPEQREQRAAQRQAREQAQYEAVMATFSDRCKLYGFREGTDPFAQCMQSEIESTSAQLRQEARMEQAKKDKGKAAPQVTTCYNVGTRNSPTYSCETK